MAARLTAIATELGRAVSTISRELRRNCDRQQRYLLKRGPANRGLSTGAPTRAPRGERREARCGGLKRSWRRSGVPSQVAHELRVRFPDEAERQLCTESIYQAVYDPQTPLTRPATASPAAVHNDDSAASADRDDDDRRSPGRGRRSP